jgi:hypothetical protein
VEAGSGTEGEDGLDPGTLRHTDEAINLELSV